MPIINMPKNMGKNTEHEVTLNKNELLALPSVQADDYFNDSSRWKFVTVTFESPSGKQHESLVFDTSKATPTAKFKVSDKARNNFDIEFIVIHDHDGGTFRLDNKNNGLVNISNSGVNVDFSKPPIPQNVNVNASGNSASVSWDVPTVPGRPAPTGYKVYRSNDNGQTYHPVGNGILNSPNFTDESLANGNYLYRVTAVSGSSESEPFASSVVNITGGGDTGPTTPAAPTLTVNVLPSELRLSWTLVTGATAYKIYRKVTASNGYETPFSVWPNDGFTFPPEAAASVSEGSPFTDNMPGQKYDYYVVAITANGDSEPSNTASYTTPVPTPTAPDAPTNLTATNTTGPYGPAIGLSWNGNPSYSYRVYRNGSLLTTTSAGAGTNYLDTAPSPGMTYNYEVRAYNNGLESTTGATTSITVGGGAGGPGGPGGGAPDAPTSLTATNTSGPMGPAIGLSWMGNPSYSYRIYRNGSLLTSTPAGMPTNYLDSSMLSPGMTYNYEVKSYNNGVESMTGATASVTFGGPGGPGGPGGGGTTPVATAPTSSSVSNVSGNSVGLSWNGDSTINYRIYRATNGMPYSLIYTTNTAVAPGSPGSTNTSHNYMDSAPAGTHTYRIFGFYNGSESPSYSQAGPVSIAPGAPQTVTATLSGNNVVVGWQPPMNGGQTAYRVYRATDAGSFTAISGDVTGTTYTDVSPTPGAYRYRVTALAGTAEGLYSLEATVTVPVPAPVTILNRDFSAPAALQPYETVASVNNVAMSGPQLSMNQYGGQSYYLNTNLSMQPTGSNYKIRLYRDSANDMYTSSPGLTSMRFQVLNKSDLSTVREKVYDLITVGTIGSGGRSTATYFETETIPAADLFVDALRLVMESTTNGDGMFINRIELIKV